MKRVIDGLVYDTARATAICPLPSPTQDRSNFGWHDTKLYRTAKGRFFIAGKGGPRSMWRRAIDTNFWSSGEGLRAASAEEARGFMESAGCVPDEFIAVGLSTQDA